LISYHRGHITVLDRPGLEREVCECYEVVKKEFDRLLSDIPLGDPYVPISPPPVLTEDHAGGLLPSAPGRRTIR
jgi:hypothetical protein